MSFSMDELVSSFASNHIGQDAMNLAALQAQLAQALAAQPYGGSTAQNVNMPLKRSHAQLCNSPNISAPSSYPGPASWADSSSSSSLYSSGHRRRASVASRNMDEATQPALLEEDEMAADERMVEDILNDPSPTTPYSQHQHHSSLSSSRYALNAHSLSHFSASASTADSFPANPTATHPSAFASTDPFYISQLQAAASSPPQSILAQSGLPHRNSPFLAHQRQQHQSGWSELPPLQLEAPPPFMMPSGASSSVASTHRS